jgi:N-acetylglucosamine-6-sulfatase
MQAHSVVLCGGRRTVLRGRTRLAVLMLALAVGGLNANVSPKHSTARASGQPNVVVIMTDDLDGASLQAAIHPNPCGSSCTLMPNFLNFLASKGTTFTNAFVSDSLCCPSRATFFTGQYAHNHLVESNWPTNGGCNANNPPGFNDAQTLPIWLKLAGYHTGLIGKYLNGYGSEDPPLMDNCHDPTYVPPGWDVWHALDDGTPPEASERSFNTSDCNSCIAGFNGAAQHGHSTGGGNWQNYQTTFLANDANDAIAQMDAPFFLYVAPSAPHLDPTDSACPDNWTRVTGVNSNSIPSPPSYEHLADSFVMPQGGSFNEDPVSDKPSFIDDAHNDNNPQLTLDDITCTQNVWRDRLEALKLVDNMIGTIASALFNKGVLGNTVIIFTSDNGFYNGQHRLHEKIFPYEDGIRVPLVVVDPPSLTARTDSHIILNTDFAQTIAELAGTAPPGPGTRWTGVDGQSFTPYLPGGSGGTGRYRFLLEHWFNQNEPFPHNPSDPVVPDFFGVRTATGSPEPTANALYMEYSDAQQEREYYDMDTGLDVWDGPDQLTNCFSVTCTVVISNLAAYLAKLKVCNGTLPDPYNCKALENNPSSTPPP